MAELATKFDPSAIEDKWYAAWLEEGIFHAEAQPGKKAYTIVIPPPNVTGILHMGHMLNNTIQDVLTRRARMLGYQACWVPGTDHASIATESKVVKLLAEQGHTKESIGREKFLEHAFEWKEKYGGIILQQLKKLGASCDWERTRFTMEDSLSKSVIKTFVRLHKKGHIYRGYRMVNWDPAGQTALSDEEVIYKEVQGFLYHVHYPIAGSEETLTIATTRPETILADTAIAVHPEDERYTHLHGKMAKVPFVDREIPIVLDEHVDKEFGTGCLKVTPAHDPNDYEIGQRHDLEVIISMDEKGFMNEKAGKYAGLDRFEARKQIVKDLDAAGILAKKESYAHQVGFSERTDAVVEPRLSVQWFVGMQELAKPAIKAVQDGTVKLHPAKFVNTYNSWMHNVRDWCISRQLWWGQRIPAWYLPDGQFVVAENEAEAFAEAKKINSEIKPEELRQDEDVLDTWFSSWLWPMSVFDGIEDPENADYHYFYPTDTLVTAPDILFFWVARMIIAGYEWTGKAPFKDVYLTGTVRDGDRRKMSKSLGNSPDPLDLIKKYGADGIRSGLMFSTQAGNDLLFDEKLCEQGRNFCNKIWNAYRLVKGWEVNDTLEQPAEAKLAIEWFENRLRNTLHETEDHYSRFRINDVLMAFYKLTWDDFCSWFLELIKPEYGHPIDRKSYKACTAFFEDILKALHPFMPFITEELWHNLRSDSDIKSINLTTYPSRKEIANEALINDFEVLKEIIAQIRTVRSANGIPNKDTIDIYVKTTQADFYESYNPVLKKLLNAEKIAEFSELDAELLTASVVVKGDEFQIPLTSIDAEQERDKLEKELDYMQGFLKSVQKKLSNDRFVNSAPEQVVAKEVAKKDDAEAKIQALKDSLQRLSEN